MLETSSPWLCRWWGTESNFDAQCPAVSPEQSDHVRVLPQDITEAPGSIARASAMPHGSLLGLNSSRPRRRATGPRASDTKASPSTTGTRHISLLLATAVEASARDQADAHDNWAQLVDAVQTAKLKLGDVLGSPCRNNGATTALEFILSSQDLRFMRLVYDQLLHGSYCDGRVLFDVHGLRMLEDGVAAGPGIMVLDEAFSLYHWNDGLAHGCAYLHTDLEYGNSISSATYDPDTRHL